MQKKEIFLKHQIYYEPYLWGGQYIVLWPKDNGTSNMVLHRFDTIEACKSFIVEKDEEPETWIQRYLG